jgi:hypothetical protein
MRPHVPRVMPYLADLLCQRTEPQAHESLLENTGITIARLGLACPDLVARQLPELFVPMYGGRRPACVHTCTRTRLTQVMRLCSCRAIRSIRENYEKETAWLGICAMIDHNPQAVVRVRRWMGGQRAEG